MRAHRPRRRERDGQAVRDQGQSALTPPVRGSPAAGAVLTPSSLAALGAAAAGAVAIAFTKPFTWQAGVVTALGIAGIVLGGLWSRFRRKDALLAPAARPGELPPSSSRGAPRRGAFTWTLAAGATLTLELVAFAGRPRRAHPTVSFYIGLISAHEVGKAVLFAAWLAGGWWICRFARSRPRPWQGSTDAK